MTTLLLLLLTLSGFAPRLQEMRAYQVSGATAEIRVEWTVQDEQGVVKYQIRRKMQRDADFMDLADVDLKTVPGAYAFSDRNVFKWAEQPEQVFYAVYAVYENGSRELLGQTGVQYTASSVRRTWGSIKAMFQ